MVYPQGRELGKRSYRLRSASAQHQPDRRRQKYLLHVRSANRKRFLATKGIYQSGQAKSGDITDANPKTNDISGTNRGRRGDSASLDDSNIDSETGGLDDIETSYFNSLLEELEDTKNRFKDKVKEIMKLHDSQCQQEHKRKRGQEPSQGRPSSRRLRSKEPQQTSSKWLELLALPLRVHTRTMSSFQGLAKEKFLLCKEPLPKMPLSQKVAVLERMFLQQQRRILMLDMNSSICKASQTERTVDELIAKAKKEESGRASNVD